MRVLSTVSIAFFLSFSLAQALSPLKEAEDRRLVNDPALEEASNSQNKAQRLAAASAYGRIQKAEGIDPLLKLLNDRDSSVQKEAAFALGQFAWAKNFSNGREAEVSQKLSEKLSAKDNDFRKILIDAIGKMGLEKTPALIVPHLNDSQASVRAASLLALYRYRLVLRTRDPNASLSLLNDDQMKALLSLAHDESHEVQKEFAYYFSRVQDPRGKDAVLNLIHNLKPEIPANEWTRFFAESALAKFQGDDVKDEIINATDSPSYNVRVAALQAALANKIADRLKSDLRGDPSYHVRMAYAQALASLAPDPSAKERLKDLLIDSSPSVKAEAIKALANFKDDETVEFIKTSLSDASWVIRQAAVQSTAVLSSSDQEAALKAASHDEDFRVRVSALEMLSTVADNYAYEILQNALKSDELSERGTAVEDLSTRQEAGRFTDAHATYLESPDEKWVEMREEIVQLWAGTITDETTGYLKEAVLDKNSSVANIAANSLRARGIVDFPAPSTTEELSFSPYRELTFKRNPKIHLETQKGEILIELYPREAPIHVANIVGFAQEKKYDGLPFHRVVSNFVIQGGDPDKSGWGSAGYSLRAEINQLHFERGSLGMPRSTGFDTGGVQFFINHIPTPHLDGQYTVFGKVKDGMEVVDRLEMGDLIVRAWVEL